MSAQFVLKKISILVFSISSMYVAKAQQFNISVHSGMELTTPRVSNGLYQVGAGLNAGIVIDIDLSEAFYIETSVRAVYTTMTSNGIISIGEYEYQDNAVVFSLRVPIEFGHKIVLNDLMKLKVSTGPWLNINLKAKQNVILRPNAPTPIKDSISLFNQGWKHLDAMWGFRVGVIFYDDYYVGISGGISVLPLAKIKVDSKNIHLFRNSIVLSLGYYF